MLAARIALLTLTALSVPQQQKGGKAPVAHQNSSKQQRGTPESPLVVDVARTPPHEPETQEQRDKEAAHAFKETLTSWSTAALAGITLTLAVGTVFLALYTRKLWLDARRTGHKQGILMRESIKEAARTAKAMELSVETQGALAAREMRAYLSVEPGTAEYVSSNDGMLVQFVAAPMVVNTGRTPAYNIHRMCAAAVLPCPPVGPFPISDFTFPLDPPRFVAGVLSAGQSRALEARADRVSANEILQIQNMAGKALVTWGKVTYDDAWGKPHWITYSIFYGWGRDGDVRNVFSERHHDTDREHPPAHAA